jgi:phosphoribosylanthranilate isomerase
VISPRSVKICSLRQPVHAEWVAEAGADMFGLIFANARRQVSIPVAREIVDRSRAIGPDGTLRSVGVFVEQSIDEINRTADEVGVDLVQLHRAEVLESGGRIERPLILVVHANEDTTVESIANLIDRFNSRGSMLAAVAVDAYSAHGLGGTGMVANWTVAQQIAAVYPTILAGGLRPENVGEAIAAVGPNSVDVSSGVETNGDKDRAKILAFVSEARRAFHASVGQVDRVPLGQAAEPVEGAQPLF